MKKYYYKKCIDCNKPIQHHSTRCRKCYALVMKITRRGKNNPYYKDGKTILIKEKIKKYGRNNGLVEHHLYGKKFNKTMTLNRSIHNRLHNKAYWYILDKYGKEGINDYISWFFKNYDCLKKKGN